MAAMAPPSSVRTTRLSLRVTMPRSASWATMAWARRDDVGPLGLIVAVVAVCRGHLLPGGRLDG